MQVPVGHMINASFFRRFYEPSLSYSVGFVFLLPSSPLVHTVLPSPSLAGLSELQVERLNGDLQVGLSLHLMFNCQSGFLSALISSQWKPQREEY